MKLINTENVNTCNAWGFGGWVGTKKTYDNGLIHLTGKNYYRHAKADKFEEWRVASGGYEWQISNNRNKNHKFILVYHCIGPEHVGRKIVHYTETDTEPFTEKFGPGITLEYEIIKVIKL